MKELRTHIEIDATPERVWQILTDFAAYPEWNPFIRAIEGDAEVGAKLEVRIEPPGGRAMTFKPTVLTAAPGEELRWLGRVLAPRLFDGEHILRIEAVDDSRVRFIQAERFRGALVPVFGKGLEKTRRGFTAMNEALKRRAEGTAGAASSGTDRASR
jgi:hypothetical protein